MKALPYCMLFACSKVEYQIRKNQMNGFTDKSVYRDSFVAEHFIG